VAERLLGGHVRLWITGMLVLTIPVLIIVGGHYFPDQRQAIWGLGFVCTGLAASGFLRSWRSARQRSAR
jgi:hypothetical protein